MLSQRVQGSNGSTWPNTYYDYYESAFLETQRLHYVGTCESGSRFPDSGLDEDRRPHHLRRRPDRASWSRADTAQALSQPSGYAGHGHGWLGGPLPKIDSTRPLLPIEEVRK